MTDIYSYDYSDLNWDNWKTTVCSWPVILDDDWKVLLHVSSSTQKFQFIGWRLADDVSLRVNAIMRAKEVLGHEELELTSDEPLCIFWEVEKDWEMQKMLLFHYKSKLREWASIWEAEWKTLDEILELEKQDMLSSKNVMVASKYFLEK